MKKRAIYISILCTVMLTACGMYRKSTKKAETLRCEPNYNYVDNLCSNGKRKKKGYKRNRYYDKRVRRGYPRLQNRQISQ